MKYLTLGLALLLFNSPIFAEDNNIQPGIVVTKTMSADQFNRLLNGGRNNRNMREIKEIKEIKESRDIELPTVVYRKFRYEVKRATQNKPLSKPAHTRYFLPTGNENSVAVVKRLSFQEKTLSFNR